MIITLLQQMILCSYLTDVSRNFTFIIFIAQIICYIVVYCIAFAIDILLRLNKMQYHLDIDETIHWFERIWCGNDLHWTQKSGSDEVGWFFLKMYCWYSDYKQNKNSIINFTRWIVMLCTILSRLYLLIELKRWMTHHVCEILNQTLVVICS